MLLAVDCLLLLGAAALSVPPALFCLEVLLSPAPRRPAPLAPLPARARLAVLVPAHNEESVLAATLRSLLPTIPAGGRVLVVADNCTDGTAQVARDCGAQVVERQDAQRRGKGFALDYGIRALAAEPPDAVVFLDADCRVSPAAVALLGAAAIASRRPVQGLNLCDPDPNGSVLQMVSGLAFRFKNLVRTLGLVRLAGLNHLSGTGMALPWDLTAQIQLAGGNVVEDMQLGINLALAGRPPLFLPEARVDSPLPQRRAAARTQRQRWEHGHLHTLLTQSPRLLLVALRQRRLDLFWLALDLAIPPLSLLALTMLTATCVATAAWLCGAMPLPALILAGCCCLLGASVLLGWAVHCREQVPLRALIAAPLYAALKLPIYLAFLVRRQKHWVRTQRDVTASGPAPGRETPDSACAGRA
jgi:cellulose synthase/poly-beta-1,6-N-acetylglucosamine synthase-like glycosyltransferase